MGDDRKINVKRSLWSARPPARGASLIRIEASEAPAGVGTDGQEPILQGPEFDGGAPFPFEPPTV